MITPSYKHNSAIHSILKYGHLFCSAFFKIIYLAGLPISPHPLRWQALAEA